MEITYLKAPHSTGLGATDELRTRVSEILRDIETGGMDAVRRYSREFVTGTTRRGAGKNRPQILEYMPLGAEHARICCHGIPPASG